MDELITTKQVQELLQVDRITVYRMLKDGRLNGVKVGKQWRFHQSDIENLLKNGTHGQPPPKPEYSPNEVLPIHCIQVIQDVFAEMNNIGVVTTDIAGEPITEISNTCQYCGLILASPEGKAACEDSWQQLAELPGKGPEFMTCHAGLQCGRAQIELHGELTAILVGSQYLDEGMDEATLNDLAENASDLYDIDLNKLKAATKTIYSLNADRQKQVGEWLERVAETFQIIAHERADLLGRLKNIAAMSTFKI